LKARKHAGFSRKYKTSGEYRDRFALWAASGPGSRNDTTKEHFLTIEIKEIDMFKPTLQKLLKDSYYAKHVPAFIQIPALGAIEEETTKPIQEATVDDLAFAAQALDKEQSALYKRIAAVRELYSEARAKGALGAENIVDALSRKGGAQ